MLPILHIKNDYNLASSNKTDRKRLYTKRNYENLSPIYYIIYTVESDK